ncbi:PTPRM [Branchiostoma lanceolatum]|uniref:protein-tyrosine-phosphatase n=1 Tax=Branchiostoma lanceolatum TaxID=7740 RepID=A0A8J9YX07_BRALA|nr:PTPRM [Branchiostoma lanceolatum]
MLHFVLFTLLFQPTICQTPDWLSLFGMFSGRRLPDNNDLTLRGISLEECARRCVEEPAFVCRSFDYTSSVPACHLSRNDRHSTGTGMDTTVGTNYYERTNTVVDVAIINQYPSVPYPDAGRTFWTCLADRAVVGDLGHATYFISLEYVYDVVNSGRFTANRASNRASDNAWARVAVPSNSNANAPTDDSIGVFSCEGEQGTRKSRAFTVKMSKSAQVKPTATTVTVSIGDPVTLTVSGSSDGVVWEKRNVGNKLEEGTSLTITPQAIEAHQGNYVLYRQADGYTAQVGVTRLIVRGCPQNKYGPECRYSCPTCHHGGWCDDVSGDCVCPPGFMGKNCELGCPRINYGQSCHWDCDNNDINGDNDDPDCGRVMLCLPDPYGCSCARGWKGLDCQTQCAAGEYGAGCTQRCDCRNGGTCDPVKGCVCEGDWSGPTCEEKKFRLVVDPPFLHITNATANADVTVTCSCYPWGEDDCPVLTVQRVDNGETVQNTRSFPDEASSRWKALRFTPHQKLATLMFSCSADTAYQDTMEFTVTGMSPQVARFGTMTSTTTTESIELNTGIDVTFVCETTGDPLPQTGDVTITLSNRKLASSTEMSTGGTTLHSTLLRNVSTTDAGQYGCTVMTVAGQDNRVVSIVVKVPPSTTISPSVRTTSPTELAVDVQISKLGPTGDHQEIIAKDIEYKLSNESSWKTLENTKEGEVRIRNLSPNTTYNVRLVLSRPGVGGRGKPGPIVTVSTPTTMAAAQSSAGAIAGGVVAALLLLVLLAGVGLFLWRRKGSPSPRLGKIKKKTATTSRPPEPVDQEPSPQVNIYDEIPGPPDPLSRPDIPLEDGELLEENPYRVQIDALPDYVYQLGPDGIKKEFSTISDHRHPYAVSKKPGNVAKNRYKNIVSYDHSRVILQDQPSRPNSDYINASYIDGYDKVKAFVACQGPKQDTSRDMWRMVWQEGTACIVMVTNLVENGRAKCERYWPEENNEYENNVQTYGDITVTAEKVSTMADYALRLLQIQKAGVDEVREVLHFQYTSWPDYGVPKHPTSTINFVKRVKASIPRGAGPTIVHCSAGVGRSGTFITIAAMLDMIEEEGAINVHDFVDAMRENRMTMVQTPDQYAFIYTALLEATQCGNTTIPADEFRDRFSTLTRKNPKTGLNAFQEEFKRLARVCPPLTPDKTRSALSPMNKNKNRFSHILASDSNRPMLTPRPGDPPGTDYINADFLDGYKRKDAFLVTQSPLPGTVSDFWRMLSNHRSVSVIMLNELNPKDKSVVKYWPDVGSKTFDALEVELVSERREKSAIVRQFKMSSNTKLNHQSNIVHQFEFTAWPSGRSTPTSVDDLLELLGLVEKWQQQSGNGPITVHCIDGVGRSGVFCTAHALLDRLKTEQVVDVFQAVKTLRNHRPNMVETEEQYQFCYQVALAYLASFDTYANFK